MLPAAQKQDAVETHGPLHGGRTLLAVRLPLFTHSGRPRIGPAGQSRWRRDFGTAARELTGAGVQNSGARARVTHSCASKMRVLKVSRRP